jgi:hypothetical protein
MMELMTRNNEMVAVETLQTIHLNADMFIIPNSVSTIDDYLLPSFQKRMVDLCKINELVENPKEKIVQIWLTNDNSDNINDHGIKIDGKQYYVTCGNIPYTLIKNVKEGETVAVKFFGYDNSEEKPAKVVFEIQLTAKQLDYRYRRFGSFEETLNMLVA